MINRNFDYPVSERPKIPYDIDPEEHTRQLAARDMAAQRAMSMIGIESVLPAETKESTGRNVDMEKI